jgi:hypothetical protein
MSIQIRNTMTFAVASPQRTTHSIPQRQYTQTTTSDIVNDATQIVGTTHEQLLLGDATDDLFCRIENLHATATIEAGIDDSSVFVPVFKIPAGGPPAILPVLSVAADVYLKSSVASTPVRVTLCKLVAPV